MELKDISPFIRNVYRYTHCPETPNNEHVKNTYTWRFMLFTAGSADVVLNGERYDCRRGTVLYLVPGQPYAVLNRPGSFTVINVFFDYTPDRRGSFVSTNTLLDESVDSAILPPPVTFDDAPELNDAFLLSAQPRLTEEAEELYEESRGFRSHREYCSSILLRTMIVRFIRARAESGSEVHDPAAALLLQWIREHLTEHIGETDAARQFGYHPNTVGRLVRTASGMSFRGYLTAMRVREAEKLLAETDMSVTEIAQYLGFCDGSHFTKSFRRLVGVPPQRFR